MLYILFLPFSPFRRFCFLSFSLFLILFHFLCSSCLLSNARERPYARAVIDTSSLFFFNEWKTKYNDDAKFIFLFRSAVVCSRDEPKFT